MIIWINILKKVFEMKDLIKRIEEDSDFVSRIRKAERALNDAWRIFNKISREKRPESKRAQEYRDRITDLSGDVIREFLR